MESLSQNWIWILLALGAVAFLGVPAKATEASVIEASVSAATVTAGTATVATTTGTERRGGRRGLRKPLTR